MAEKLGVTSSNKELDRIGNRVEDVNRRLEAILGRTISVGDRFLGGRPCAAGPEPGLEGGDGVVSFLDATLCLVDSKLAELESELDRLESV
jgi:hypothetical protein